LKIYTKTGDQGETSLLGGVRVSKSHICIEVCGSLDELNSVLGLVRSGEITGELNRILLAVQNDLFDIGGRVAGCLGETNRLPELDPARCAALESRINEFQSGLPELKQFILPDGSPSGCRLHLARSICRRAERNLVSLMQLPLQLDLQSELVYLNRLSDFLFVAARFTNLKANQPETPWTIGRSL
jgi:cob(I)alamin adenosyltransferase